MLPNTLPDIPFESEAQLRDRGTSKTPDVLLQYPIGIPVEVGDKESDEPTKWKMICWIDSKVFTVNYSFTKLTVDIAFLTLPSLNV